MPKFRANSLTYTSPSKEQLEMATRPYSEEELSSSKNLEEKIDKLMKFFDLYGIKYDKFKPERLSYIDKKEAYPNYDQYIYVPGQHDTSKWLSAVKEIYYKQKSGLPYKEAIRNATNGWKKMEVYDFLNWLRFYEEGAHMKYKFANVWYENGEPGYFLEVKPDKQQAATPIGHNPINDAREEVERSEEKKQVIEKQRQKIIGRLDSAEKLLRSPDGQQFAGKELETLMEAIFNLKKKVQLVNKLSSSIRLYEDMIVREANVLVRHGFNQAAKVLHSIAQAPLTPPTPPDDPAGAGHPGAPGGLPAEPPGTPNVQMPVGENQDQPSTDNLKGTSKPSGMTASSPTVIPQEPPQSKAIKELTENMNDGINTETVSAADDNLEVTDHLEVQDSEDHLFVTEAQVAPPRPPAAVEEDVPMTTSPAPDKLNPAPILEPKNPSLNVEDPEEQLEVTENDMPQGADPAVPKTSDFDARMDSLLSNVTIGDIVAELEDLAKIFKIREIPRRLSLVDMMLDSKGLASYFPSLSEAQNKALESNNYISTRVEDILSKLRGAMATKEIDLTGGPGVNNEETQGIKGKLEQDTEKEKQRKQMRKEQENAELDGSKKETPRVEINEDLRGAPPIPPTNPIVPKPLV